MTNGFDGARLEPLPERGGTFSRVLATIFVLVAILFWLFAFFLAPRLFTAPDQISDERYVSALDARCAEARASLLGLPPAQEAVTLSERADVLVEANDIIRMLRQDLDNIPGGTADDRRLVGLWLGDWDVYLSDRAAHVERLRAGEDGRFLTTEENGVFINERMNGFARVNNLDECETPGDV